VAWIVINTAWINVRPVTIQPAARWRPRNFDKDIPRRSATKLRCTPVMRGIMFTSDSTPARRPASEARNFGKKKQKILTAT
jgi:hypothetical protein